MNQTTKARPAPKFAHVGKFRRYSFISQDKDGRPVRAWHDLSDLPPELAKSLRGMVRP